ncbi:SGNH/GDSL hydrolase family protein [Streptomyces sp. NPDC004111]|uniref:SGNH/GDSL hydrolase family protein n=1 Tax=Streptomyces sp. NPDC004111 TaxID=3364690 RepID=UPI003695286B
MNTTHIPSPRFLPRRGTTLLTVAAAGAAVALTACGGGKAAPSASSSSGAVTAEAPATQGEANGSKAPKILWMGDSIGEAEAPALGAALKASGAEFKSMAAAGGGGVIGEIAAPTWEQLPKELKSFSPEVVVYQITTYDWGTAAEQKAGYKRLAKAVNDAGAELVMVSAPPFKIDDFYKPNEAAIKQAPKSAKAVADKSPGKVRFVDASALWGTDSAAAKAQRSKDGIHSCQQGSAAFAKWLSGELGQRYSFEPAPADTWATGAWTGDKVYGPLGCK